MHVFDDSGQVVYSTALPAPAVLPPLALAAYQRAETARWQVSTGQGFLSGVSLADGSGRSAGGVLIEYPVSGHLTQVRAMAAELGFAAIGGFVAISLIGAIVLRTVLGRMFRSFHAIEAGISRFEQGAWRSAAGASDRDEQLDQAAPLHRDLLEAEATYRELGTRVAGLARQADTG